MQAASHAGPQNQRVVVKTGTKIKIIPVEEINYIEAADDFVKIYTGEGSFLKNKTMSYFEQVLDKQHFVRTHRSYIVHIGEITRLEPYEKENYLAILKSGAQIPVSRNGYPKLKAVLGL
jgi:two-component system LytT family response regulator